MTWQFSYLRALELQAERQLEADHARLAHRARQGSSGSDRGIRRMSAEMAAAVSRASARLAVRLDDRVSTTVRASRS